MNSGHPGKYVFTQQRGASGGHIVTLVRVSPSSTAACFSVATARRKSCIPGRGRRVRRGTPSPSRAHIPQSTSCERLSCGLRRRSQQARGGGGACAPLVHSSLLFLLVLSADNIFVIGAPAPCPPPACPMRAHQAHPRARSCAHRPTRGRRRRIRRDRRRRGAHDWSGSVLRERLGA